MARLTLEKSVDVAAPADAVFDALTDPEKIVRFFPLQRVESERREGGSIKLFGEVDGDAFVDDGRIDDYTPSTRFQYTYSSDDHGTERSADTEMTISYGLRPFPAGTWVEALHENPLDPERHAQMEIAWDFLLAPPKDFVEGRSD